jgi:hypothetical protein
MIELFFNIFIYFFSFLIIFFIIYRLYIYRFGLKPLPCMNDKCVQKRLLSNDSRNNIDGL